MKKFFFQFFLSSRDPNAAVEGEEREFDVKGGEERKWIWLMRRIKWRGKGTYVPTSQAFEERGGDEMGGLSKGRGGGKRGFGDGFVAGSRVFFREEIETDGLKRQKYS